MNSELRLPHRQFQSPAAGPHLLVTAGVHGDEFEPMAAVRRLLAGFSSGSTALVRGTLTLVPVVNESAFERCHRTGDDQLDLARVCPGNPTGSVTERVAHALSKMIRAADYYIDLHTGGTDLSVAPLTGYTLHPDPEVLEQQRKMAQSFNLPIVWGTAANLPGRSLSVARDAGVPAIYAEYLGSARCSPEGIDAYEQGCLHVLGMLGMIDHKPPESLVQHTIEDARPGSGHMQVCNPAPVSGFFEPDVTLGQTVHKGQRLGTVTDVLGEHSQEVVSDQDGLLVVLRTFSRVEQGQSLCVIAESS